MSSARIGTPLAIDCECSELLGYGVQPPERTAVVVLVVALDQRHRKPAQRPGAALDLLQSIAHVILLSGEPAQPVDQPGTSDDADEAAGDDERQSRCGSV